MTITFHNPRRINGSEHGGKIKHGDVGLAVVVDGVVKVRELLIGGEVGSFSSVIHQIVSVDIGRGQKRGCVWIVLENNR